MTYKTAKVKQQKQNIFYRITFVKYAINEKGFLKTPNNIRVWNC